MDTREALSLFEFTGRIPSSDEIKSTYRKLMKQWHPDRFQTEADVLAATKKAQAINEANCILEEWLESAPGQASGSSTSDDCEGRSEFDGKSRDSYKKREFTPGFPDDTAFEFFVRSSHIVSAGYNPNTKKMYIKFDDTSVYEYCDVHRDLFDQFMQATSHGRFAHGHIYPHRKYRRCEEPNKRYRPEMIYSRMSGRYNADPAFRISG